MTEKIEIEKYVSKVFIEKFNDIKVEEDEIILGNHIKNEPDILYKNQGIELGAIISSKNTEIDKFEHIFFDKINQLIKGKIHPNFSIKLVFQDDKDMIKYFPRNQFKNYKYLSKYLYSFFLHLNDRIIDNQVSLNQMSLMRQHIFPNPNKKNEINGFINDLINFINKISPQEFKEHTIDASDFRGSSLYVSYIVCDGERIKENVSPLDKFFSSKIIDKFKKDKYSGHFDEKILLLHNFNPLHQSLLSSDIHFYQHYKDHIFNKIVDLITKHRSLKIYNNIYFADFSVFANLSDFRIIDFSEYTKKILKNNLSNEGHIRISLI